METRSCTPPHRTRAKVSAVTMLISACPMGQVTGAKQVPLVGVAEKAGLCALGEPACCVPRWKESCQEGPCRQPGCRTLSLGQRGHGVSPGCLACPRWAQPGTHSMCRPPSLSLLSFTRKNDRTHSCGRLQLQDTFRATGRTPRTQTDTCTLFS